jgi:iron-sulfur cluster repair protein YtfE (RIC family)
MTIGAAWANHPGAPTIFAKHHLPACDGCAVRHDETLAEAAAAYGIDLPTWLAQLNNLHTSRR